jgi:hypothetical protein
MKVQLKNTSHTNLEQLKEEILQLWVIRMEDSAYLKNLIESMPQRLQGVIEWGGNITHHEIMLIHMCSNKIANMNYFFLF